MFWSMQPRTLVALQVLRMILLEGVRLASSCAQTNGVSSALARSVPKSSRIAKEGAIFSTPCSSGTYGDQTRLGTPLCSGFCPAGSFCPLGSKTPIPCYPGSFSGEGCEKCTGVPLCLRCKVGLAMKHVDCVQKAYAPSAVDCIACSPGRFQPSAGQSSCALCPSGFFQDVFNASECHAANECYSRKWVNLRRGLFRRKKSSIALDQAAADAIGGGSPMSQEG